MSPWDVLPFFLKGGHGWGTESQIFMSETAVSLHILLLREICDTTFYLEFWLLRICSLHSSLTSLLPCLSCPDIPSLFCHPLACFSANRPFFCISCLLMNEIHSSSLSLWGGGVRWSVNSYRLCLLPFFHFTIHFHGDRTAGWEAPGSKVKSDHLLNSSLWFPLGITYCNPKTLDKYLSLQRQTTKGGRGKRRKRLEKRGGLQSQGQGLFSAVFSDGLWRLYMGGIVRENSLYLLRGRIRPTLCSPCAQIKLSLWRQLYLKRCTW